MSLRAFIGSFIFLLLFSFMLSEFTHTTSSLLSPLTLGIAGGVLAVVIGASSTPVVKGVAMLALFLLLVTYFVYSPAEPLILALVIAPILLTLGLSMSEIGRS